MWVKLFSAVLILTGIAVPLAVGAMQEGYDPVSQYLSELGALDAPNAAVIKYAAFLPTGLALAAALTGLYRRLPASAGTALGLFCIAMTSVSYAGAVFYPCDPGCPAEGSARQSVHNALGLIGYAGPIAGLFILSGTIRGKVPGFIWTATLAAAIIMLLGFLALATPEFASIRGAAQRAADFTLFLWVAVVAYVPFSATPPGETKP